MAVAGTSGGQRIGDLEDELLGNAADPVRLGQAASVLHQSGRGGVLWIVAPAPSHAFRTNPGLRRLNGWIYDNCQLRNTLGVGRVDYRQNFLKSTAVRRWPPSRRLVPVESRPRNRAQAMAQADRRSA